MVDEVRVLRLLRSVSDDVAVLALEGDSDADRRRDPMWLRGIKYTFITAIESCVDVAHHIDAAQKWGPPRDNGDAIALLGRHGVLSGELADRLRRAVGFRNVLVHDYVDVDDDLVVARLKDVGDLEDYVSAVVSWLSSVSASAPRNWAE